MNNNEILFWKVFHNKYLFNLIFEIMENSELFNNNEINFLLHEEKRIKFKYIYSLKWMIKNSQFQLLKSKLINNEYVYITNTSIKHLFRLYLIDESEYNGNNRIQLLKQSRLKKDNIISIKIELFKEILKLILEKRDYKSLYDDDDDTVIEIALSNGSYEVIKILFESLNYIKNKNNNKNYGDNEAKIINKTFESHIMDLMGGKFSDGTTFSLPCISKNRIHAVTLESIMLDHLILIGQEQQEQQQQQQQSNEINEYVSSFIKNSKSKLWDYLRGGINLEELEVSINFKTKYKLLDYIKIIIFDKESENFNNNNKDKLEILFECIKLYKGEHKPLESLVKQNDDETIQELLKQLIILSKSKILFKLYLSKYHDSIGDKLISIENFKEITIDYGLHNYIPSIFKQIDFNIYHLKDHCGNNNNNNNNANLIKSNLKRSIEFLRLLISKINYNQCLNEEEEEEEEEKEEEEKEQEGYPYIKDTILNIMLQTDKSTYEELYKSIPNKYKNNLPFHWNPILSSIGNGSVPSIAKDIETIDLLNNWVEDMDSKPYKDSFHYDSNEIIEQRHNDLISYRYEFSIESEHLKLFSVYKRSPILYQYSKGNRDIYKSFEKTLNSISLEFIQQSSFDDLIDSLIYRPYKEVVVEMVDGYSNGKGVVQHNLQLLILLKRKDLFLKELELIGSNGKEELEISKFIIKWCCINLELTSINYIFKVIKDCYSKEPSNDQFYLDRYKAIKISQFCLVSLQLGKIEITKLSFTILMNYLFSVFHMNEAYQKFKDRVENYNQYDYLINRNSLTELLHGIIGGLKQAREYANT
ncbi:hypothetical protein ACTFIW_011975 [Dictyostelium discoideum]